MKEHHLFLLYGVAAVLLLFAAILTFGTNKTKSQLRCEELGGTLILDYLKNPVCAKIEIIKLEK